MWILSIRPVIFWLPCLAALIGGSEGCQPSAMPIRTLSTELRGKVAFTDQALKGAEKLRDNPLWIWNHGERGLLSVGGDGSFSDDILSKQMVIVTFPKGSSLGQELRHDPLTHAYDEGTEDQPGFAMVDVSDPSLRDHLAFAAHQASGHTCGAMETIDLKRPYSLTLEQDRPILPAFYTESVKIPAVESLLQKPSQERISAVIAELETMGTRFHQSETGLKTPDKVKDLFSDADGGRIRGLRLEAVETQGSAQASVVAEIPGQTDDSTVIIGAHLDSIHRGGESYSAPGADDDASGIAVLVETLRVIAESGARFQRRVEFHAYGAEEVGLLGSVTLAQKYADDKRPVAGMLQIDMNAWSADPSDDTIHLVTTTTTPYLVRSSKDLLHTYLGGRFSTGALNAGASDHKSWFIRGFPVIFPFEKPSQYNPTLHTEKDTSQNLNNLPMALRFSKFVLAFLSHEAGLVTITSEVDKLTQDLRKNMSKDLKLAVIPSPMSTSNFTIQVAAAQGVKSVDLCRVNGQGSMVCYHERVSAKSKGFIGDRYVYAIDLALALSAGDRISVFGYNDQDKLIAQRTIKFAKR